MERRALRTRRHGPSAPHGRRSTSTGTGRRILPPVRLTGPRISAADKLLLVHGAMDDQVHPDDTLRLADRFIAAYKDFELLIMPGAERPELLGELFS
nr:S9 family peptidase [Streptomyces sp. CG 926]